MKTVNSAERLYWALRSHLGSKGMGRTLIQRQVWVANVKANYPELVATLQARIRLEVE